MTNCTKNDNDDNKLHPKLPQPDPYSSFPSQTTIRVFAKCLRSDIEYKTISVNTRASCREVVALLLSKYRMRHRDPNLFYLTMEVTVRRLVGAGTVSFYRGMIGRLGLLVLSFFSLYLKNLPLYFS